MQISKRVFEVDQSFRNRIFRLEEFIKKQETDLTESQATCEI